MRVTINMEYIPLYELTANRNNNTAGSLSYEYDSWNEFIKHTPWTIWNHLEMVNYVWTLDNSVYIYYKAKHNIIDNRHFKIKVTQDIEPQIRKWIKAHMINIWKI